MFYFFASRLFEEISRHKCILLFRVNGIFKSQFFFFFIYNFFSYKRWTFFQHFPAIIVDSYFENFFYEISNSNRFLEHVWLISIKRLIRSYRGNINIFI